MRVDLVGLTIVAQRQLSATELHDEGWAESLEATALELDNGAVIYAAGDNGGPASLIGYDPAAPDWQSFFEIHPL